LIKKLKPKSEFSRNVLTLMTGTAVAQAIPIAISPVLTRIYSPHDFGVFALYMSMVSIVAIFTTGKYDLAIMMPKRDNDAVHIVVLSIFITIAVSIFFLLVVIIFNKNITDLVGDKSISNWLYLSPLSILLTGIYQSINYWSNRKKEYKRLAVSRVVQSGTATTANLGLGMCGYTTGGLIIGGVLGQVIATSILGRLVYISDSKKLKYINIDNILKMAKKYITFPKYVMASEFVTVLLLQLPILFLSMFFNIAMVGFYNLVQRILGMPMTLLSRSVSDVFKEKASADYNQNGQCKGIYLKTLKILIALGIIPFSILFFYAPAIFSFVFGEKWITAGEFAQILSVMFFLKFVSSPLSYMFYIVGQQKKDFIYHLYLLASSILIFYIVEDINTVLILYSINYSFVYILYIVLSYSYAKGINVS
jgi:O-antigen/teichoic acid export membrane protein